MNEQFRTGGKNKGNDKQKFEIPTHDPQTGEANPHYEELTGKKETEIVPETDLDKLNRFLINTGQSEMGLRGKLMMLKKMLDVLGDKED